MEEVFFAFSTLAPGAERCECCGAVGFLARNRDLSHAPAWCVWCHEPADTTQAHAGHPCEDGYVPTTDHDGLRAARV
ncbi:hypothetical protein [Streptomyces sp. 769]|uniref:hypothetical protein n=1 Tax=Streptomyces sp. 769 TaxID=1262452 RepID=UPI0005807336|nr:hypothetical protein [Streptomyces sp. 769]AJC55023.1 hypothetical protein GZL_02432 [Streptomyces sp. 769]